MAIARAQIAAPSRVRPARPARPARPRLRVVDAPTARRRLGAIGILLVFGLFALLFGLVVFQTVLVQNQHRIDTLDSQVQDEQARFQQLRLEAAQLEAPARIVDAANRLGMVPPPGTTYLTPSASAAADANTRNAASGDDTSSNSDWTTVKPLLGSAP